MKLHYERNKDTYKEKAKRNTQKYHDENRERVFNYLLTHPCVDCGESDPIVLEFDHQRDKLDDVSNLMRTGRWDQIRKEIEKCEVVCANCHRRRSASAFGYWKLLMPR